MARTYVGTWKGGRIYEDKDGAQRFVIERMRDGERYSVTLPLGADPELELLRFKRDPAVYRPPLTDQRSEAIVLDVDEVAAYAKYKTAKGLAMDYIRGATGYLMQWASAFDGRDLRAITVTELYALLDKWSTAREYRTKALKSWASYSIRRQRLPAGHAITLLEVEKAGASRLHRKVAYSIAEVEQFYSGMASQHVRDLYLVAAKTGMHATEIGRIASGDVEIIPVGQNGIAAVVRFVHKSKRDHRQSIDAQTLAAVRRLMAVGKAPSRRTINNAVWRTTRALGLTDPLHPKYLRHSFATWLKQCGKKVYAEGTGGLDHAEVAAIIGHTSGLMLKWNYDGAEVPPMAVVPITLHHPSDPAQIIIRRSGETITA